MAQSSMAVWDFCLRIERGGGLTATAAPAHDGDKSKSTIC